ncbi:hypothetical protein [Yinghuangia soli]|uniref:Uncharacterized protein n=1 Tax=Yinghuangia soli TaxID=2908204 RepID=A0AA41Q5E5_9ACTN|nr:hypothetical protein [Yinghuangia soli]MCF2531888.1 hypothetical protein [Yinghuangia soli]
MEPIPAAVLGAIAGGAGGDSGREAWAALSDLVRQLFRRSGTSGDAALSALEERPDDPKRAEVLSQVLAARAHMDPEFAAALDVWKAQADKVALPAPDVRDTVA